MKKIKLGITGIVKNQQTINMSEKNVILNCSHLRSGLFYETVGPFAQKKRGLKMKK